MNKDKIVDVVNGGWIWYEFGEEPEDISRDYDISKDLVNIGIKMFKYLQNIQLNKNRKVRNATKTTK